MHQATYAFFLLYSEDSDQSRRNPRTIEFFAECTSNFDGSVMQQIKIKSKEAATNSVRLWSAAFER